MFSNRENNKFSKPIFKKPFLSFLVFGFWIVECGFTQLVENGKLESIYKFTEPNKLACFCKRKKFFFIIKSSWLELVKTRRSIVPHSVKISMIYFLLLISSDQLLLSENISFFTFFFIFGFWVLNHWMWVHTVSEKLKIKNIFQNLPNS